MLRFCSHCLQSLGARRRRTPLPYTSLQNTHRDDVEVYGDSASRVGVVSVSLCVVTGHVEASTSLQVARQRPEALSAAGFREIVEYAAGCQQHVHAQVASHMGLAWERQRPIGSICLGNVRAACAHAPSELCSPPLLSVSSSCAVAAQELVWLRRCICWTWL